MAIKKEGNIPINARVDVDYTGKKPKVKFTYPKKNPKKSVVSQGFQTTPAFVLFLLLFITFWTTFQIIKIPVQLPSQCSTTFYKNDSLGGITNMNLSCDTGNYTYKFNKEVLLSDFPIKIAQENSNLDWENIGISFGGFLLSFFLAWLITYLLLKIFTKTDWYKKNIPKLQARGPRKYYKFKPEDVENNLVEIPSFSNVILDYNTTGDFNKYLERIKIREHKYYKTKKKNGKYKKTKLKRDDYKWYARFYFKQKPNNGYLEVFYQ